MGNSIIQLPADDIGKKVQTFENTVGSETVHAGANVEVTSSGAVYPEKATEATAAEIKNAIAALNPISNEQLRAADVNVSLAGEQVEVSNFPESQAVTGPLTDEQLRSQNVSISGEVLVSNFPATQPVSGSVSIENFPDTQPISATVLPLPTGAATEAKLEALRELLASLDIKINVNSEDRLRVSTKPGTYDLNTQDISANGGTFPVYVDTVSNVMVHCVAAPAVVGHNVSFEGSLDSTNGTDGTWFAIQAARSNANTVATTTGVLTGNPGYAWELSVNACKWFRIRATAHTSGTMRWFVQCGSYATEPIPINQVTTVTATAGSSGMVVYADSVANLAAAAAFTGTSRDAGSTPAYNLFVANVYADQAGTLYIQKSTDGTTWRNAGRIEIEATVPAELMIRVTTRYNRVYFLNGAAPQTVFQLTSSMQRQ